MNIPVVKLPGFYKTDIPSAGSRSENSAEISCQ